MKQIECCSYVTTRNVFKGLTVFIVIAKSGYAMVVLNCEMIDIVTITAAVLDLICFVLLEKAMRNFIIRQNIRDERPLINENLNLIPE